VGLISFLVFIILQIVFVPIAIVGAVLVGYKQMVISKRLEVSQTGIEVLNGRWAMHVFDIRQDLAAVQLADAIPNTSTLGLWFSLFPLWVKYKISGEYFGYPRIPNEGAEGIADLVVARTLYFDRIIERVLGDVEQFVLLGAGYDTRAYGALNKQGVTFFELDQPTTQKLKVASLRAAGIDASHVTFVEVDFSKESVFEKLRAAGYDPAKKTLFLWEGVTLYLNEVDVRKTLQDIKGHAAPGSVVLADFYAERFIRIGTGKLGSKVMGYTNEGLGFGLPFVTDFEDTLKDFITSDGLKQGESYFMGRVSAKGPFMVVAELCV
jgi:methyltransferase (TIGR00027 family)